MSKQWKVRRVIHIRGSTVTDSIVALEELKEDFITPTFLKLFSYSMAGGCCCNEWIKGSAFDSYVLKLIRLRSDRQANLHRSNGRTERVPNSNSLQFIRLHCRNRLFLRRSCICRNHKQVETKRKENVSLRFQRRTTGWQTISSSTVLWQVWATL